MNTELTKLAGIGPSMAASLADCGFSSVEKIAKSNVAELCVVSGIGAVSAARIIDSARKMVPSPSSEKKTKPSRKASDKKSKKKAEKKKKSSKKEKKRAKKKAGEKSDKKRKKKKGKR